MHKPMDLDKNTIYLLLYKQRDKRYITRLVYSSYFTTYYQYQWRIQGITTCRRRVTYLNSRIVDGEWFAASNRKPLKILKGREAAAAKEQALKENGYR